MQNVKKMLILLTGLAAFLCAPPVSAEEVLKIGVPYAQHGDGWWTGLALSNSGPNQMWVTIYTMNAGSAVLIGSPVPLGPYSQDVRLLPDFFTESPYPKVNGGRVSLWFGARGATANKDFKATLFMGNSEGGFGFQSYDWSNREKE